MKIYLYNIMLATVMLTQLISANSPPKTSVQTQEPLETKKAGNFRGDKDYRSRNKHNRYERYPVYEDEKNQNEKYPVSGNKKGYETQPVSDNTKDPYLEHFCDYYKHNQPGGSPKPTNMVILKPDPYYYNGKKVIRMGEQPPAGERYIVESRFPSYYRLLKPGDPMTNDYNPGRLNILVDENDFITELACF